MEEPERMRLKGADEDVRVPSVKSRRLQSTLKATTPLCILSDLMLRSTISLSLCVVLATVLLQAPAPRVQSQSVPTADLLLINAHVITIDRARPAAEAIAIKGDRIVWLG